LRIASTLRNKRPLEIEIFHHRLNDPIHLGRFFRSLQKFPTVTKEERRIHDAAGLDFFAPSRPAAAILFAPSRQPRLPTSPGTMSMQIAGDAGVSGNAAAMRRP